MPIELSRLLPVGAALIPNLMQKFLNEMQDLQSAKTLNHDNVRKDAAIIFLFPVLKIVWISNSIHLNSVIFHSSEIDSAHAYSQSLFMFAL